MDTWGQSFEKHISSYNQGLYASNTDHANMCTVLHSSSVTWLEQIPKFPSSPSQFFFFFFRQAHFRLWATDLWIKPFELELWSQVIAPGMKHDEE